MLWYNLLVPSSTKRRKKFKEIPPLVAQWQVNSVSPLPMPCGAAHKWGWQINDAQEQRIGERQWCWSLELPLVRENLGVRLTLKLS